jgi:hypothetical protein
MADRRTNATGRAGHQGSHAGQIKKTVFHKLGSKIGVPPAFVRRPGLDPV